VAFYDEKTLSLLLMEDTSDQLPVFVQLVKQWNLTLRAYVVLFYYVPNQK
jgi:hypothetical protein